ncbi:MAG: EAL domain-containing protein [Pseudomonadota bacterium]|nr:EAL domain-containing protein [Pseudomonadota bacterium]
MNKPPNRQDSLRSHAEARVGGTPTATPMRPAEELLHEIQVNQIELEMQNEELRRAQSTLEESRDRYVDLYEFSPVGHFTLSDTGLITEANLTGAALLGEERKRLLHRRFARFVTQEDRDVWQRKTLLVLMQGGERHFELALQRVDGSRFHAGIDCLLRTTGGKLPIIRIALTDISERKHAEEEQRIAAVAFESPAGMLVTDAEGTVLRVNLAFTRMTGYGAEEAVGKPLALLKSEHHDESFYQNLLATLKREKHWQGEIWNRRKNGKIYAEWMTLSAVASPEGMATHYVGTISDITQNVEAEAEIHRLAYYDPLTRLPNRRLLLDRLRQALAAGRRSGRRGALLYLDLDDFKKLNDTHGHDVGDLLLVEVTRRLHEAVREGDTISRQGGDEFVVMLENLGAEDDEAAIQAELVGEKVRAALALPYDLDGHEFHGTSSLGIALFHGHDESVETLLKQADIALYQAKGTGRNCVRFFDPAMQSALNERGALEADLRQAVSHGQLQLYYQAQIDRARRVIGVEALLRWRHPQRGLVAPDVFIPLAEDTGLILPIGHWVLNTACAQIKAWSGHAGTRDLRLAINISARQFRQPGFVDEVRQVLAETGADPSRLKFELTERLVFGNVADTIAKMEAFKEMGIGFSMDDFGAGYSSLSNLKRLPLEQLKIDRSFVNDLISGGNDAAIVQTIIAMGETLGLKVIAEGVETEAQLECLDQYRCATFQGYVFSRPVPLAEFEKLLEQSAAAPM